MKSYRIISTLGLVRIYEREEKMDEERKYVVILYVFNPGANSNWAPPLYLGHLTLLVTFFILHELTDR